MRDTTIVLQGPIHVPATWQIAAGYATLEFVDRVIVSTWYGVPGTPPHWLPRNVDIEILQQPENGTGNMNLQIYSSVKGIDKAKTEFVVKMRSDQWIPPDEMERLNKFFRTRQQKIYYHDLSGPQGPICVLGMSNRYPFHPQDHIFWGHRKDVHRLFDIPLMTPEIRRKGDNFAVELRCPIYLGAHYYANFDPSIYPMINKPVEYLVDAAPKRQEALDKYNAIRDQAFHVFPRIKMNWVKYGCGYMYDLYSAQGEYYAD